MIGSFIVVYRVPLRGGMASWQGGQSWAHPALSQTPSTTSAQIAEGLLTLHFTCWRQLWSVLQLPAMWGREQRFAVCKGCTKRDVLKEMPGLLLVYLAYLVGFSVLWDLADLQEHLFLVGREFNSKCSIKPSKRWQNEGVDFECFSLARVSTWVQAWYELRAWVVMMNAELQEAVWAQNSNLDMCP